MHPYLQIVMLCTELWTAPWPHTQKPICIERAKECYDSKTTVGPGESRETALEPCLDAEIEAWL